MTMSLEEAYALIECSLKEAGNADSYAIVGTENGIAVIGEDVSDVWLVTVRAATLEVA